jgi:hypothetical protein
MERVATDRFKNRVRCLAPPNPDFCNKICQQRTLTDRHSAKRGVVRVRTKLAHHVARVAVHRISSIGLAFTRRRDRRAGRDARYQSQRTIERRIPLLFGVNYHLKVSRRTRAEGDVDIATWLRDLRLSFVWRLTAATSNAFLAPRRVSAGPASFLVACPITLAP